jgi:hypothetical protein
VHFVSIFFDFIWYIFNRNWADTQWQQYITHLHTNNTHNTKKGKFGKCRTCPVFASYTLAFALQLRKKHGKTSVRVAHNKTMNNHIHYTNKCITSPIYLQLVLTMAHTTHLCWKNFTEICWSRVLLICIIWCDAFLAVSKENYARESYNTCTKCIRFGPILGKTKQNYATASYNTCTEWVSQSTHVQRVWTMSLTKKKTYKPGKNIISEHTMPLLLTLHSLIGYKMYPGLEFSWTFLAGTKKQCYQFVYLFIPVPLTQHNHQSSYIVFYVWCSFLNPTTILHPC